MPIRHGNLNQNATCPGIRVLRGLDAVIASEWGRRSKQGRGSDAAMCWGVRKNDWNQGETE